MPSERLRDTPDGWGLSIVDNARLARMRQRDRDRKRARRLILKLKAPPIFPDEPVDNLCITWRLTGQDVQDLGIIAYRKYVPNRTALGLPLTAKGEGDWISLPWVSILHGEMR